MERASEQRRLLQRRLLREPQSSLIPTPFIWSVSCYRGAAISQSTASPQQLRITALSWGLSCANSWPVCGGTEPGSLERNKNPPENQKTETQEEKKPKTLISIFFPLPLLAAVGSFFLHRFFVCVVCFYFLKTPPPSTFVIIVNCDLLALGSPWTLFFYALWIVLLGGGVRLYLFYLFIYCFSGQGGNVGGEELGRCRRSSF